MTTKTRIQRIEQHTPKQEADTPIYQCVLGDVVKVAWLSGRVKVSKSEQFRTFDAGRVGT